MVSPGAMSRTSPMMSSVSFSLKAEFMPDHVVVAMRNVSSFSDIANWSMG